MKFLLTLIVGSLFLAFASPVLFADATAAPVNVAGEWKFQVETGQGTGTPSFTLKQDGGNVTGDYKGAFGEAPVTGTVKHQTLTLQLKVSGQGQSIVVEYVGTVDGDKIKGKVRLGDFGEGNFTGERVKQ